jgi:hypothetical protein
MRPVEILIVISLILLGLSLFISCNLSVESYINVPSTFPNLNAQPVKTDPAKDQANVAYRTVLMYAGRHPQQSFGLLRHIKDNFFNPQCTYKQNIDFSKIAKEYKPVF